MRSLRHELTTIVAVWGMLIAPILQGCNGAAPGPGSGATDTGLTGGPAGAPPAQLQLPAAQLLPDYVLINTDKDEVLGFIAGKTGSEGGVETNEVLAAIVQRDAEGNAVRVIGAQYQCERKTQAGTTLDNVVLSLGPGGRLKQIVALRTETSTDSVATESLCVASLDWTDADIVDVDVLRSSGGTDGLTRESATAALDSMRAEVEALAEHYDQGLLGDATGIPIASGAKGRSTAQASSGAAIGWSTGLRVAGLILAVGAFVGAGLAGNLPGMLVAGYGAMIGAVNLLGDFVDAQRRAAGLDPVGPPTREAMRQWGDAGLGVSVFSIVRGVSECLSGNCGPLTGAVGGLASRLGADLVDALHRRNEARCEEACAKAGEACAKMREADSYYHALAAAWAEGGEEAVSFDAVSEALDESVEAAERHGEALEQVVLTCGLFAIPAGCADPCIQSAE